MAGDASDRTQKLRFNQSLESISTDSSLGSKAMLSFGGVSGVKRSGNLVFSSFDQEEFGEEFLDEYFTQLDKKRRLTVDQVHFLERSFKEDNKLEPERKIQLANELGLQPRQIAVWFQNRRARWKTKHLETDYETLRARYETLKTNYDNLLKENDNLKAEALSLKQNNIGGDIEKSISQSRDPREANAQMKSDDEESKVSALAFMNEEQSSAKSEVTNTDSPRITDGIHSPLLGSGVTCREFEPDYSDSSQNGGDNLHDVFPHIEDIHHNLLPFYYGFPVEDHAFNFWSH